MVHAPDGDYRDAPAIRASERGVGAGLPVLCVCGRTGRETGAGDGADGKKRDAIRVRRGPNDLRSTRSCSGQHRSEAEEPPF